MIKIKYKNIERMLVKKKLNLAAKLIKKSWQARWPCRNISTEVKL